MINAKFGLYSLMLSLMLGSAPAWADVDISSMNKVEVGSWAELKAAVEDSANAGKAIVLTKDITADKDNPITSVGGAGIIIDGGGFTITGQEGTSNGQFINYPSDTTDLIIQNIKFDSFGNVRTVFSAYGGAIFNYGTIGDISGDFSGNYAKSTFSASGGAINNYGTIGNITGDFTNNYAKSDSSSARGGAIYNVDTIGDITGDFSGNYAQGSSYAFGGAISNVSTIGDITGDFSGNHAKSDSPDASGGAIYNTGTIGDISGDFTSNYAQSTSKSAFGGAIFNDGSKATIGDITGDFSNNYAQGSFYAKGGAIYNYGDGTIGNIVGNFSGNYAKSDSFYAQGGAIYNYGTIGDITGDFTNNYAQGHYAYGGAIYNFNDTIGDISGDFSNNYAQGHYAFGGAIFNDGSKATIGDITGDFTGNYAQSESNFASGGAIYNSSTIGDITGDFIGNYAQSDSSFAQGGAIYNEGTMTLINSSFYDNYVETVADKNSYEGMITQGGAIYTVGDLTIKANNGQSIFSGNKVKWANGDEESSGIYMLSSGDQVILSLDSRNEGLIQFDDKISAVGYVENYLKEKQSNGYTVTDDGNGHYTITSSSGIVSNYLQKDEKNFWLSSYIIKNLKESSLESTLANYQTQGYTISQDENGNYTVIMSETSKEEFILQDDGTYWWIPYTAYALYGANMTITGDSSSHVEFNNALENIGSIDISGTNVDVNEGVGTIYRTVTHDGGVLNINAGATAEDSVVNDKGTLNVADTAKIYRTEVNDGGVLNVASGGYAQDTTVNSGGLLVAEDQAKVNNMLANDGANLDIDAGSLLTGNIIIHAGATMGGSYDYSQIFKDEVAEDGSLTLVGGLNGALNESSLINTTEGKRLHLTGGDYVIGDGAQAVKGWDLLTFKDNADVKLEGDITLTGPNKKLIIENGSNLNLAGNSPSNYTITGSVSNDGMMTFTHPDDEADDLTTIYGNYTAYKNAQMTIDVNPTENKSDLLRIDGNVAGTTNVVLNIVGADVAPTELLQFVDAQNDDLSTGAYFKIFRVDGSAFKWNSLYKDNGWYTGTDDLIPDGSENGYGNGDMGNIEDDTDLTNDAVLPPNFPDVPSSKPAGDSSSPSVVGEAIAYMGLPSAGIEQTRGMTRNISNKVAATKVYSKQCNGFYDCQYDGKTLRNAWAAPVYSYSDVKAPYSYEAEISGFEGGFDVQSDVYNRLGVFASYRQGSYDFDGDGDDYYSKTGADMDIDSYILGLYHRYDEGRKWMMSQIFLGYQDVSMSSDDGVSSSTDGIEFGAAIEGGLIFNPMTNLTIEPIIRLAYTQINYDDASDAYGKTAEYGDVRNIEVEAGVKVEKTYLRKDGYAKLYVKPSIIQNIGSGDVQVTSLRKVDGLENSTLGRIEVGGSMSFDEQWSGFANAAYTFGSDYTNLGLNAGLNYAF